MTNRVGSAPACHCTGFGAGAYPPGPPVEITHATPENHANALKTIPNVKLPKTNPMQGADGPLVRLWKRPD